MYLNMKVFLLSVLNLFVISPSVESASLYSDSLVSKLRSNDGKENFVCLVPDNNCTRNQNLTCFGTVLSYVQNSIVSPESFNSSSEVEDNLEKRQHVNNTPCWFAIQPLLCARYTSDCRMDSIHLPFNKMFNITHDPCRSNELTLPVFLRSENEALRSPRCWDLLQEAEFNAINTQYQGVSSSLFWLLLPWCIYGFSLVVIILLKVQSRQPSTIIFYIVACLYCCLWLYNPCGFLDKKETYVCTSRETLEKEQLGSTFGYFVFSCINILHKMINVWNVVLTFGLHVMINQTGILKDIKKNTVSFHIIAWNIPVVLTTAVVALTNNDSNSVFLFYSESTYGNRILLGFIFTIINTFGVCVQLAVAATIVCIMDLQSKQSGQQTSEHFIKLGVCSVVIPFLLNFLMGMWIFPTSYMVQRTAVYHVMNSASSYSSIAELPVCVLKRPLSIAIEFYGTSTGILASTLVWIYFVKKNYFLFSVWKEFPTDEKNTSTSEEKSAGESQISTVV